MSAVLRGAQAACHLARPMPFPAAEKYSTVKARVSVHAERSAARPTLWMVRGGMRCLKPPRGARLTEVANFISALRSALLRLATTCSAHDCARLAA